MICGLLFTGSEHYANTDRFANGYLKNNKPDFIKGLDVDKFIWKLKKILSQR